MHHSHPLSITGRTLLKSAVIGLLPVLQLAHGGVGPTTLWTEDFNTDGEGSRYTSSAFDDGGSDFFERLTANPDGRHNVSGFIDFTFTAPQGAGYWGSEDIEDSADNPLVDHAIVRLNDVDVSGFTNLQVNVYLARTDDRFDLEDKIEIQYAFDGDSGGGDLSDGTYATIGRFIGDTTDIFGNGPLRLDTNLNGIPDDAPAPTLTTTMVEYAFPVPASGTNLSVQIRIEQNGGSEEIAFDHIQITGNATVTDPPALANLEEPSIMFTEGDPATQVTNAITVTDPDSATLSSAQVRFTAGYDASEDVLAASPPASITAFWDPSAGILTLNGTATLADYQAALRSVTYQNLDNIDPSIAIRAVQFLVSDGSSFSNLVTRNVQVESVVAPSIIPYLEDFDSDGEGARYTSSTYRNGDDFFERSDINPAVNHSAAFTFNAPQGGGFWASEDVNSSGNPLGDHGIVRLPNLDASGLSNLEVSLFLGELAALGEFDDTIEIQYAFDGDIPANSTDLSSGNYTTVGRFIADSPDAFTPGPMTLDSDLDGVTHLDPDDSSSPTLSPTMTRYPFLIPGTGNLLSIQIRIEQNGGGEELAFDQIEVTGSAVNGTPPTLANIEGTALAFGEGDPATLITNTIAVSDPDPSLIASATVQITGNFDPSEDLLSTTDGVPGSITAAVFNLGTGTLALTGSASPTDYEAALRAVTYRNSDPINPSPSTRTVSIQVVDGDGNPSNIVTRQVAVVPVLPPGTVPILEEFETEGNGERYVASSFNTGASNPFFERVTVNPDPRHNGSFTFAAPQGGAFWAGEDIENAANPLGDHGIIRLQDLAVTGWTNLYVSVHLGQLANTFDLEDKIEIQYALDGDSGAGDLTAGTYTTVGRFVGDTINLFGDAALTADTDLDGTADAGGVVLSSTMTQFTFPLPDGADLLSVQVRVEQNGASEEFAIDSIEVGGSPPLETVVNAGDSGPGSLRQAIADIPSGGIISFDPTLDGSTITLTSGELLLNKDLTIDGSGLQRGITLSGGRASRVMNVASGSNVTLECLTIADGSSPSNLGGGIFNTGKLVVRNCALVRNKSFGGGAISNTTAGATLQVVNSTITANTAAFAGAVLHRDGDFQLIHSTLSGNVGTGGTGALVLERGTTTIENSIVAGNTGPGSNDLGGGLTTVTASGANVIGTNNGNYASVFPADGFLVGTNANPIDPRLAPFGRYGGCTDTFHPLAGSPAFDNGIVTISTASTDQRGLPRNVGPAPDIGALEGGPTLLVQTTSDSGFASLRQVITDAAANPGTRIYFDLMAFPAVSPITLTAALNQIDLADLTVFIDGSEIEGGVEVSGDNAVRIFNVDDGSAIGMANLNLRDGNTTDSPGSNAGAIMVNGGSSVVCIGGEVTGHTSQARGGAIEVLSDSSFTATGTRFLHNASGGNNGGGAIYADGAGSSVSVEDCTFTDNTSPTTAGAIHGIAGASLSATGCYFARNTAIDAGAVRITIHGTMTLENCTFDGNEATNVAGAIYSNGDNVETTVRHCTIVGNAAGTAGSGDGGGIRKDGAGSLTLENSIVSGNTAPDNPDLSGGVTATGGVNLIGNTTGAGGIGSEGTDYLLGPPLVAPAANYGGPTLSMPPLPASAAVDAAGSLSAAPDIDQRGYSRVQGSDPDIGAVERAELFVDNTSYFINDSDFPLTSTISRDDTAGDTLYFQFTVNPSSDFTTESYEAGLALRESGFDRLAVGNGPAPWAYSAFNTPTPSGFVDLNSANPDAAQGYEYVRAGVERTLVFRVDYVPGASDNVSVWLAPDLNLAEFAQPPTLLTTITADAGFDEILLREQGNGNGWNFTDISVTELSPFGDLVTFAGLHPGLDPDGDENGDGLSNYYHYAAGDDPANPVSLPTLDGNLYTHSARINGRDVFLDYEYSTDLGTFFPMIEGVHFDFDSSSLTAPGVQSISIEVLFDPLVDPRVFWHHRFVSEIP